MISHHSLPFWSVFSGMLSSGRHITFMSLVIMCHPHFKTLMNWNQGIFYENITLSSGNHLFCMSFILLVIFTRNSWKSLSILYRYNCPSYLLRNLAKLGFREPTPIQRQAIPVLLHVWITFNILVFRKLFIAEILIIIHAHLIFSPR